MTFDTRLLAAGDDIPALTSETGGDTVTTGGIRFARELSPAGLVEEHRLFT